MADVSEDFSGVDVPAIMISVDHQVSEGRIIRFSTGVPRDVSAGVLNGLLDKLAAASDRQQAKHELQRLEDGLKREEKIYVQQQEDLVRLDEEAKARYAASGRKAEWTPDKLTGAQIKDRENAEVSIARRRDTIIASREQISKLKAMIHAHDGGANSHQSN